MGFKVLDNRNNTNLEKGYFATLSAIKGMQFGREVYSTVVKFKDVEDFLEIFPNVQRNIIPRKVASIRRYIISGLNKQDDGLRFFSSATVTCKGYMFYDEVNKRLAIDTNDSKLSINDGQHRYEAIKSSIQQLEKDLAKSKDKAKTAKLSRMIDELSEMVIPLVIFNGLSEKEEKQLFFDLNNLAQRPSKSANIKLNQKDILSRMARELSRENRYLKYLGVETDKMSIHENNPNSILLTTIHSAIKELLSFDYKLDKFFINEENYNTYKEMIDSTFDKMFFALPSDINIKGKYLLEKGYTIRAISRFICHCRNHLDLQLSEEEIFKAIEESDWTYNIDLWSKYNGIKSNKTGIVFGTTNAGFRAVYNMLMDKVSE